MGVIVGVHGIAQDQLGRRQLLRAWEPALCDGVEIAGGRAADGVPFDLAFYGHLYLDAAEEPGAKGGGTLTGVEDLDGEELDEVIGAAAEILAAEEIAAAQRLPPDKGYTRMPGPVQAVLRALDARFGRSAGVLYLGALRQVRRYLREPELKAEIDGIVEAAVTADCTVVVAHSLGSVVALEYLRQHPEHEVDLFLTLGSPLGLRMVQSRLPEPWFAASASGGRPDNVRQWVNVRDPHDPVACAGDLSRWWTGVEDRHVDNAGDAHNVARYLSKQQAGSAILHAVPDLGSAPGTP